MAEHRTAHDRDSSAPLAASDFRTRRRPAPEGDGPDALHVCPSCDSRLVYPVDWAPAERRSWNVDLRCPDCEWSGGGLYPQDVVDRFDEELDRGTEELLGDLRLLVRASMEDQVERFVAALRGGHVLPEDF